MSVTKRAQNYDTSGTTGAETPRDRRAELLAAAARVFVAKGFHETRVSDIVAEAGTAQGTFYLYFKTKTDVLYELVHDFCQAITTKCLAAVEAKAEPADPSAMREEHVAFFTDLFHWLESDHQAAKLILAGSAGVDPAVDRSLAQLKQTLVQMTKESLEGSMEAGCIRKLNSTIIAEAIVGMIYHLAFQRFVLGRRLGESLRHLAEEIVDFELNGILKEPGQKGKS